MKYTDKLNLINTFSGIALAVIPYLLTLIFNWDEITKTKTEQVFLILTVVVIFILTLITTLEGKKIAKIAGFSYGYFYNFIYEVSDLITDEEAIIVAGGKKYHIQNREGTDTLPLENVKIIIILPNDVYAQYRFCELLRGVMEKAVITPADDAYYSMREKTMNVIEVKENNKYALLLIDTPPTTMRAVKLYRESLHDIDHNLPYDQLDSRKQRLFEKICAFCKKNAIPIFRNELHSIINKISSQSRVFDYNELIKILTLEDVIAGIISPQEFESLKTIGDNRKPSSEREKNKVRELILKNKSQILDRITVLSR
jgi:hypothetical protein